MLNKNQEQSATATNGSTSIQAQGDVTIIGVTPSDVLNIANQVFEANFYKLSSIAHDIATARAKELVDLYLGKLIVENPDGLKKANDPDFQYSLFTAQKEYARTGDKNLGELLVNLLIDRSKEDQRNLIQIVLSESLAVAPKLTDDQLAALSMAFFFNHVQMNVSSHEQFGNSLDRNIAQFVPKIIESNACYQHLEFSGCGSVFIGNDLEQIIGITYQGLFLKGFELSEITSAEISIGFDPRFFQQCINDNSKIQVTALNEQSLKVNFDKYGIMDSDREKIANLFSKTKMDNTEIRSKCIEIRPYMIELFEKWKNSNIRALKLTSVGIAIAHANIKKTTGDKFADLSIWIN